MHFLVVSPNLFEIGATAVYGSPGGVTMPADKTIDGNSSIYSPDTCPQSMVTTNPWLRIDLKKVYLVVGFQVFPYGLDTSGAVIVVGRFPTVDVVSTFYECGRIDYVSIPDDKGSFFFTKLCGVPQLAEYVYMVKVGLNSSVATCEVVVYYGEINSPQLSSKT